MVARRLTVALVAACLFVPPFAAQVAEAQDLSGDQPMSLLSVTPDGSTPDPVGCPGPVPSPTPGTGLTFDGVAYRQCFGQQALLADALTRYNLENNVGITTLSEPLFAEMVQLGYLPWRLEDPRGGGSSAMNYRLIPSGQVVCAVHGARRVLNADEGNQRQGCYALQRAMSPYVSRYAPLPEALRAAARARMNRGSFAPANSDLLTGCQFSIIPFTRTVTCALHGAAEEPAYLYTSSRNGTVGR